MFFPVYEPAPWQRGVQKIAALPFVSGILAQILHRLDPFVLDSTHGKRTATTLVTGLPVVWLTTTGAHSGKTRTVPLVGIPDDSRLLLVASYFGKDHNPGWYYNLKANPVVHIRLNGSQVCCMAQEVGPDEYNRLWEKAIEMYHGYSKYKQRAAGRRIPLITLTLLDHSQR